MRKLAGRQHDSFSFSDTGGLLSWRHCSSNQTASEKVSYLSSYLFDHFPTPLKREGFSNSYYAYYVAGIALGSQQTESGQLTESFALCISVSGLRNTMQQLNVIGVIVMSFIKKSGEKKMEYLALNISK